MRLLLATLFFISHLGMAYAQIVDDNVITLGMMGAAADLCSLSFPGDVVDALILGALNANGGDGDQTMAAVQAVEDIVENKVTSEDKVDAFCNDMLPLSDQRPT